MKIKLTLVGSCGRMGRAIAKIASEQEKFELVGCIESDAFSSLGKTYTEVTGIPSGTLKITSSLDSCPKDTQVVIDFSTPDSTLTHLQKAANHGIAYVIGTTAFDKEGLAAIAEAAKKTPVLLSPNMSLGMNVVFLAAEMVSRMIGETYDIEIIEAHHNKKMDAPSGTTLKLLDMIRAPLHRERECAVYGRKGLGKRTPKEIGVHVLRAGDIVGEHKAVFAGFGEHIELTHRAETRETFAHGALRCAEFLVGKPAKLYDMKAVLGFS
jgi:4-hydroxy-tetrahydrodipicolinate reductase